MNPQRGWRMIKTQRVMEKGEFVTKPWSQSKNAGGLATLRHQAGGGNLQPTQQEKMEKKMRTTTKRCSDLSPAGI